MTSPFPRCRNLGISTVKGVWRRFLKQRRDELMKTLKLRSREEVPEAALLQDVAAFLAGQREALRPTDDRRHLPLYKQIRADVEERPLTVRYTRPLTVRYTREERPLTVRYPRGAAAHREIPGRSGRSP